MRKLLGRALALLGSAPTKFYAYSPENTYLCGVFQIARNACCNL